MFNDTARIQQNTQSIPEFFLIGISISPMWSDWLEIWFRNVRPPKNACIKNLYRLDFKSNCRFTGKISNSSNFHTICHFHTDRWAKLSQIRFHSNLNGAGRTDSNGRRIWNISSKIRTITRIETNLKNQTICTAVKTFQRSTLNSLITKNVLHFSLAISLIDFPETLTCDEQSC